MLGTNEKVKEESLENGHLVNGHLVIGHLKNGHLKNRNKEKMRNSLSGTSNTMAIRLFNEQQSIFLIWQMV